MKFQQLIVPTFLLAICLPVLTIHAQTGRGLTPSLIKNDRLTLGTESNRSASVRMGDVDGDGDLDVVVANGRHWPQQNFLFLNQGRSNFTVMRPLGNDLSTTYACELADLDGDGDLDVATGNDMAQCEILLNDGKGNFEFHSHFGDVSSLRSLTTADIDNDGDIDILSTCRGRPNQIYLNNGDASFKTAIGFGTKNDATIDVAVADVNKDGHADLLLANRDNQPSSWLLNDGENKFTKSLPFGPAGVRTRAVAVGDLNGDEHLDWVAGNIGQANVVYLGDGTGSSTASFEFGAASQTYSIDLADMNGDGKMDIVAANVGDTNSIFFNEGNGESFKEEPFGGKQHATYGICVGDLNNDGRVDVAVANSGAMNLLFLNRTQGKSTSTKPKTKIPKSKIPESPNSETSNSEKSLRELPAYQSKNWPAFRGTGARGVAEGFELRTEWNAEPDSAEQNGVLWETAVPGLGHSSPVVYGNKVYLVTAVAKQGDVPLQVERGGNTNAADDNDEQEWLVLCYDKTNGEELGRRSANKRKPKATRHAKATHANTSVCTDGKHLLAFLGSEGLHCFDMEGKPLWSRDLGVINISKYGIGWGFSSSPAVHKDRIVILCDDPDAPYVAALNLNDGEEVWKTSRDKICERSWGTPLIHEQEDTTQVVVNGWPWVASYDLENGEELWRIKGGGDNPVPTPFEAHGWFYITSAHGGPSPIYVVDPESRGTIIEDSNSDEPADDAKNDEGETEKEAAPEAEEAKDQFIWSLPKGGSYMSTPVVYGDYLYLGTPNAVVRCYHAKTGEKMFEKRLGAKAGVIASLVAGDGKIFVASENGTVYVLAAGPEFNILASNPMHEPCFATPAISEGALFIRTTKRLIAIK